MILIEKTEVMGFDHAIRGMRNPMNSWDRSDSGICKGGESGIGCANCAANPCSHGYNHSFQIGKNDYELMMKLVRGGPVHAKFRRMIAVYVDITAPLYWWKEFDTYKVGWIILSLNGNRRLYIDTNDKKYWWQMIQLLPSYNQKRTVMLNYEVLSNIYKSRKNHKLDEWRAFCWWIEKLPYSELILGGKNDVEE